MASDYNLNHIGRIRPGSTFDTFEAETEDRKRLLGMARSTCDRIVSMADRIEREEYPFDKSQMLFLHGKTGRGKTHLIEAMLNDIVRRAPPLARRIWLARGSFTLANIGGVRDYGRCPIIVIDDLFADRHSLQNVNQRTDIQVWMEFIAWVYENRRLVIVTSNFPVRDGLATAVAEVDKIGRITSRMREIMAASGEVEVTGRDFREDLAKRDAGTGVFEFIKET